MSKYFDGDKMSGYEDSAITYVYGGNLEECHKFIADLEVKVAELQNKLPVNDDKHARRNPQKAVEVLKKYINLIEDIYYYTIKYIDDTEIPLEETFDKLLDQLDELLERKAKEMMKSE